ncbi:hypothetical protein [Niabella soli]|nr:hypothetical protein [Niabella soli]
MDFLQQLNVWAKGDALQGKIMVGTGLLLALALPFLFKKEYPLFNGMFIPICLLVLVNLGYGGFLLYSRPKHVESISKLYQQNPRETVKKELQKARTDNKNYTLLKPIWAMLIIISALAFFFINNEYFKGASLGMICLSVGFLLIDTFLHYRLIPYLELTMDAVFSLSGVQIICDR